jgi:Fur family ferric uptake transcriptional regulator
MIFNKNFSMELQNRLNNKGLRLTQPRRVVMDVLQSTSTPLKPQDIYQQALDAGEDIGLVSVYRTLDLLLDLALVRRVHGEDGCQGYVCASPGHHHHLVCTACGKAIEFSGAQDLTTLINRIKRETGYIIDGHLLQLQGLCPNCQKEKQTHENKTK